MSESIAPETLARLVESHDEFLRFLQARLGNREVAQDVLQAAFVKGMESGGDIRDGEKATAWFYRLLRNAIADHYRRAQVERRALQDRTSALEETASEDPELERAVCKCMNDLIPTLKPEYAGLLRRVELEGATLEAAARAESITPNNAMVRLHRARKALHGRLVQSCGTCTEHGCLDCHCKS